MRSGLNSLSLASDYLALLKPRVMSLVVFTGFAGLVLAPGELHPLLSLVAVSCIAFAAGGAGAINMWYDRDIDALMARTRNRPIPAGRMAPQKALTFGFAISVIAVIIMGVAVNWVAAALLAFANAFYVFVYTIWLKRRTPQNIVIGGAAGAMPPLIGWAAVTGTMGLESFALFLLIFLWTPPHFWALSLCRTDEYAVAGVPMLPVVVGKHATRRQILIYSMLLVPVSLAPLALGIAGAIYATTAIAMGGGFLFLAYRIITQRDDGSARRMFQYSIFYLFILFLVLIAERLWDLAFVPIQ